MNKRNAKDGYKLINRTKPTWPTVIQPQKNQYTRISTTEEMNLHDL